MAASVQKSSFGKLPDGTAVDFYTLTNANGLVAKVTNYGAIITELHVPDRQGKLGDVVLGFDNLEPYLKRHPYFGATVGRVANRIAKGRFTLDGKTYTLATNNGPNHLHGGLKGFDKVMWKAAPQPGAVAAAAFAYTSPDGEEGYPGTLTTVVTMILTDANELRLDYQATTDQPTPVNLTNHSYFNLAGQGDILGHEVMLAADYYTPSDSTLIPTGEISPVNGTPMDFTQPRPVGSAFAQLQNSPVGYDHNYVLNAAGKAGVRPSPGAAASASVPAPEHSSAPSGSRPAAPGDGRTPGALLEGARLPLAARVCDPGSGRIMEVLTTQPGVQFYTGNFLDGSLTGKRGTIYRRHAGLCLETQHFPDAVNQSKFPPVILRPGQTYRQVTVYKFPPPK